MIYCPTDLPPFPPLEKANKEGLLAVGGDLSPERLICAYSLGIFPWFEPNQEILWWSPDPRCVLIPSRFRSHRSFEKTVRRANFRITYNKAFEDVINACAAPRKTQNGTWITDSMLKAYQKLHELGYAHSAEVWQDDQLVGGLYGVALGHAFFGESMFSTVSDASKFALQCLCQKLHHFHFIDCQVDSAHLRSLGAQVIPRVEFIGQLQNAIKKEPSSNMWSKS